MTSFSQRARWTFALLLLLKLKGPSQKVAISTTQMAKITGMSQQSASRLLKELEREGLVKRGNEAPKGTISFTEKAISEAEDILAGLIPTSDPTKPPIPVTGVVFSGMSEGAYYMRQRGYSSQFAQHFGFQPYPGTLNLRFTGSNDVMNFTKVLTRKPVVIKGFQDQKRTFGDVLAYPVTIEGKVRGAVVRSLRTVYDVTVAELIAPVSLRKELTLRDGDRVTFSYGYSLRPPNEQSAS